MYYQTFAHELVHEYRFLLIMVVHLYNCCVILYFTDPFDTVTYMCDSEPQCGGADCVQITLHPHVEVPRTSGCVDT